jgi:hypothetical protein
LLPWRQAKPGGSAEWGEIPAPRVFDCEPLAYLGGGIAIIAAPQACLSQGLAPRAVGIAIPDPADRAALIGRATVARRSEVE